MKASPVASPPGLPPTLAEGRWRVDGACEDEYGQEYELRGVLEVTPGGGVRGSLHEDGAADPILVLDGSVGAGRLRLQLRYAATVDTYKYDGQMTTVRPCSMLILPHALGHAHTTARSMAVPRPIT